MFNVTGYKNLINLHVLPMEFEDPDGTPLHDIQPTSLYVNVPQPTVPSSPAAVQVAAEAQERWWKAFEQCLRYTLRSLSFPSNSGRYLTHGFEIDNENARNTIQSLLSSGSPLPKSPSMLMDESDSGRQLEAVHEEREERGWWAVRFQQVLRELQRQDIPLPAAPSSISEDAKTSIKTKSFSSGPRKLRLLNGKNVMRRARNEFS